MYLPSWKQLNMGLMDKLYKLFDNKATMHLRVKTFLWYYRILHTTFGGLTIDSKDKLSINKYWKAYGLIFGLLIGIWNCISIYFFGRTKVMTDLYHSKFTTTYYLFLALKALVEIRLPIHILFPADAWHQILWDVLHLQNRDEQNPVPAVLRLGRTYTRSGGHWRVSGKTEKNLMEF